MDAEALVNEKLDDLLNTYNPAETDPVTFLGAQFDAGLAWVHFPVGKGGLGLSRSHQTVVNDRIGRAGGMNPMDRNPMGYGMGAPTVLVHGSEEQQEHYLRRIFTAEDMWCQLFSEPGAGSDVASLSTTAVRDGDEWIVNGQKVWTTLAHVARYGMLVARTDPNELKHKGLTYFVVDMHAPGVEVRPLRQMTGEAEFNEVYFTDVRVPDSERLGEVGEGWRVSLTTLMNERVSIGGNVPPRGSGPIAAPMKAWATRGGGSPAERDRLVQLWIRAEVLRLTNARATAARSGETPGPEGSIAKLMQAELNKEISELTIDLMGAEGMLYESYEMRRPESTRLAKSPAKLFLRSRANSIEGGTSEIMRNILGERVLGLPGDIRVDKDRPWKDVPRS